MSQFDMRGQKVSGNQYNAGRDLTFGAVQNQVDLVAELEKLQSEFAKAVASGAIPEDTATDAQYQVTKAVQQAKKPDADKKTILDHLNAAKTFIDDIAAAGGLVTALTAAIQVVQKLFS
jgi:hypothetical protein